MKRNKKPTAEPPTSEISSGANILTLSVDFDYTTLLFIDRAVLRLRIFDFFCSAAACETGGRSGGNPAIWVPDATFVGGVELMGGGNSSDTNCANDRSFIIDPMFLPV